MSTSLRDRFYAEGRLPDCPIYDLHGHWGPHPAIHLPAADPAIARPLLDQANVRRLVLCHHYTLFTPDIGNRINIDTVRAMPDILRAYMGINPNHPDETARDLATFDRFPDVFVGFKLLADYHRIKVGDDRNRAVWEFANARRLPVLLHTWGGSAFDGYDAVREVAERYPEARIICGHSIHGDWDHAVELARNFPNLYQELTAVPDERGPVERLIEGAGSKKIIFGTDFPWFSHAYYVGALLGAGVDDESLRDILYRNAQRILGEPAH
ncbi:MAG: hypothetical protein A2269_07270 [Lentisphaerae bacterium RIFOXYA12_FULL_60_10]|nr:MAG: hypothetical protein A2269_07270 [Lentisphaerae bacterium RIFOXYA12_FULL_60_10]